MQSLWKDLGYALRSFRSSPGFAATAVLLLAIGIGANTAIFSVTNALLLRPLPYKDSERLAILWNRSPGLNVAQDWFSTAQYFDIKRGHSGFSDTAIAIGALYNLTGDGDPDRVTVVRCSSNLLPIFGAGPERGRLLLPEEDVPGHTATAVLSYGLWERRYGRDPAVIGKRIILNAQPYQVVGVLPRSFVLPHEVLPTLYGGDHAEIFVPLPLAAAAAEDRRGEDYNVVAKLQPGVTLAQAQAEMDTITARLRRDHPDFYPPNGGLTFGIVPLLDQVVGDVRLPLRILLGAMGCVLLIACANVANLLLSRALTRQKEMAIRSALGAGRGRLIAQLLTESLTLALCGAALGVLFAVIGLQWVHTLGPESVPRVSEITIDGRVLLFTVGLSVLSGLLFGMAPAWRLARLDLQSNLKEAGRGASGAGSVWGRGQNLRRLLVVSELALSVVLLIGAGLLIRSFQRLQGVSPGFNPHNVLTMDLAMKSRKYADHAAMVRVYRDLLQRLEHVPGATAAGAITALPFSTVWAWGPIQIEGRVSPAGEKFIIADERVVAGHYFEAMQIPLLKGRLFDERDYAEKTGSPESVAIIDEYMAEQFWPGQDPLGRRVITGTPGSADSMHTIVGVVGRVKQYGLESDSRVAMYMAHGLRASSTMTVVLRTTTDPASLSGAVRKAIHELDPDLPIYALQTMDHRVEGSLAQRRFTMTLLGIFSIVALTLTVIGVYGMMSYLVTQGERELGIRMALGATQTRILKLVVGQGATVAGIGVAAGLAGAFALSRLLRSLLFGVRSTDPVTFSAVALVLLAVALIACYVPARRAARIDPWVSLRCE
jgi:predicted permease